MKHFILKQELKDKGHAVEVAGIFYHAGENDMAFGPYRREAAKWLQATIAHQEKLVITAEGIVKLGELLARSYLKHR